jgi:hypothetical protein
MRRVGRGTQVRRVPARARPRAVADDRQTDVILVERRRLAEPVAVEIDRPLAYRPKVVGFWRGGEEFHTVTRVVETRREHDAVYYRLLTDRGAFDLRHVRRMHPLTLRVRREWELCAELDAVPIARRPRGA